MALTLTVLIATLGEKGLQSIASRSLPEVDGVGYLISCQHPGTLQPDVPAALKRPDINVVFSPEAGLSRNRNLLNAKAESPLCLIADDDLDFSGEGLDAVIAIFRDNPGIGIATFRFRVRDTNSGKMYFPKPYPENSFPLNGKWPKGYYVSSVEIAFRREAVVAKGLQFDENFGVGSGKYGSGEEELWMHYALKAGLQGMYFPETVTTHHGATTAAHSVAKPEVLMATGYVIALKYPFSALWRLPLKAWRVAKSTGKPFIHCLRHILQGAKDCIKNHPDK